MYISSLFRLIVKEINKRLSIKFFSEIFSSKDLIRILNYKFSKAESFIFKEKRLKYFYHSYNNHRLTERAIEIPIIKYYLEQKGKINCLEIGNVTTHYYSYFQDIVNSKVVVDKYEKGPYVINKDIKDYNTQPKFDFIFSISSFEHMDSDRGRNPDFIKGKSIYGTYAADNIIHVCENLLKSGGIFIITAPIGYTDEWDQTVFEIGIFEKNFLKVKSVKIYYFRKINEIEWKETDITDAKTGKYNYPLPQINVLSVVEIKK